MMWDAVAVAPEKVTPEFLYDISRRHKLIPERVVSAIDFFRAQAPSCVVIEVIDRATKDTVAEVIISDICDGESAAVDFVPTPKYFSPVKTDGSHNDDPFHERIESVMGPVFRKLIAGRDLRRLTAMVPRSRSRTYKALMACGFKREGAMRNAVKFKGTAAEDLIIMGMLPVKENGDGV